MTDRPEITIRSATAADRAFLESLNDRLIDEAAIPGFNPEDFRRFQARYTAAALDHAELGAATLVAVDPSGQPLGYVHLRPEDDFLTGEPAGYVSILVVRAEAQGRGIGKMLLKAADDWARALGYRELLLDVFTSNETARRFYERNGFVDESLRLRRPVGS